MWKSLRPRSVYDVMAAIACFGVLAGGTAYAANTIGSADIIDESIVSADIKNYGVKRADIGLNSINTDRIENGAITSSDIGLNAVTTSKVLDESVDTNKVLNNSLTGLDIADTSLDDNDVGQAWFVDFAANIGTVPAHQCVQKAITGIGAQGDHLLLTPSLSFSSRDLIHSIRYTVAEQAMLQACNISSVAIDDGVSFFNLLVIDAQ